jgi:cell division protein FtsB
MKKITIILLFLIAPLIVTLLGLIAAIETTVVLKDTSAGIDNPVAEKSIQEVEDENKFLRTLIEELEQENAILGSCCANKGLDAK